MINIKHSLFLFLVQGCILWFFITSLGAQALASSRSTALVEISVYTPVVEKRHISPDIALKLQKLISLKISQLGYLKVYTQAKPLSLSVRGQALTKLCSNKNLSSTLAIEVKKSLIRIFLRSCSQGHLLARWTFPKPQNWSDNNVQKLTQDIAQSIVQTIPYKAVVSQVQQDQLRLLTGKTPKFTAQTKLRIFDLSSSTLSSPQQELGVAEVIKVENNIIYARLITKDASIKPGAKADILITERTVIQKEGYRYDANPWIGGGIDFIMMDTQVEKSNMDTIKHQILLSSLLRVSGGYGPISAKFRTGRPTNENNELLYQSFNLQFDFYTKPHFLHEKITAITSIGGEHVSLEASPKENTTKPLHSFRKYSAYLDQHLMMVISQNSRLFGGAHIYYPISYNVDELQSKTFTSYGLGAYGGIRVYMSTRVAFEGQIAFNTQSLSFDEGKSQSSQYVLGTQILLYF